MEIKYDAEDEDGDGTKKNGKNGKMKEVAAAVNTTKAWFFTTYFTLYIFSALSFRGFVIFSFFSVYFNYVHVRASGMKSEKENEWYCMTTMATTTH